jgi:hypothetical protein
MKFPTKLSVAIPFSREEWTAMTMEKLSTDGRFIRHYHKLVDAALASPRGRFYIRVFGISSFQGKLPAFDPASIMAISEVVEQLPVTDESIGKAAETIMQAAEPGALPSAAIFELLAISAQLAEFACENLPTSKKTRHAVQAIHSLSIAALVMAINIDFGLSQDPWKRSPGPTKE